MENENKVEKRKGDTSAKVYDPPSLFPNSGTSCVHQQRVPLDTYKYSFKLFFKKEEKIGRLSYHFEKLVTLDT